MPGVLLAIDTSIGTSVALGRGDEVCVVSSVDERGHAEAIGALIARVFAESGILPAEVVGVVAGVGPGPFTGLRVGIAAAKAFATGRGVPLLPLSGHEAVGAAALAPSQLRRFLDSAEKPAEHLRRIEESPRNEAAVSDDVLPAAGVVGISGVRVLQDARRKELFVTEYSGLDTVGLPVRTGEPYLLPRADYVEQPGDVWPAAIPAAVLLRLAELRLASGRDFDDDRALYLRSPDVYPSTAPKRVSV